MSYLSELLGDAYKEGMSEEELSKAIEKAVGARDRESEKEVKKVKASFDRTASEVSEYKKQLAEYKKQLAEKMSEEERAKSEQDELLEKLRNDNEMYKKQIAIAESKAQLASLGYSEDLAAETAEALYSGDLATVYKNQRAVMDAKEKEIRAGVIKETPIPPAGVNPSTGSITLTQLRNMSIKDRYAFAQEHPEEYNRLYTEGKD